MKTTVVYDDRCPICRRFRSTIQFFDWFKRVHFEGLSDWEVLSEKYNFLERDRCQEEMHLINSRGNVYRGYLAFRRIMVTIPLAWVLLPILYLPGISILGGYLYKRTAKSRGRDEKCCPMHS
jgi:predicted DCC family thiol-disulfide oxidoreductase YuxK